MTRFVKISAATVNGVVVVYAIDEHGNPWRYVEDGDGWTQLPKPSRTDDDEA